LAPILGHFDCAVDRTLVPGKHDLARVVVIGDGAHFALSRGVGDLLRKLEIGAEQRRHCSDAHRHRCLHRLPAKLEQLGRRREVERTRGAQRRIFAEAVPRDELRGLGEIHPAFARQCGEHCQRIGHYRRLRILGQPKLVVGAVLHQPEQVLPERLVDLFEDVARRAARVAQGSAHADRLAALTGKKECAHVYPRGVCRCRAA
jgi:hypothetical protein